MTLYIFKCLNCGANVPSTSMHHKVHHVCHQTSTSTTYGVLQFVATTEQTIAAPPETPAPIAKKLNRKTLK